jgi:SPP1 gp7 family putative phage head morphogenesis protein
MLPDKEINTILQKFGPQITKYLQSIGYFDISGPYEPLDIMDQAAMRKYLVASKAKNAEVWSILEKWLFPEMVNFGEDFIAAYALKKVVNVRGIATDYMKVRGGELIKGMAATDKKRLTAFIWNNAQQNERPLARMILKEPNLSSIVSPARAKIIVRTERGRAVRSGSQSIAIGSGAKEKTWVTAGDRRVRPSHRSLNGTTWSIEEDIPGEGQYPGQIAIGCRCHLQYGFDAKRADYANPSMSTLEELYS